ncbi:Crp/Fnr family transcriptional regulator [Empedobacter brevis]|uniref:Crp/Fnr family transcriptional regulator n=1 Tax=Empedobacter brevis TaxID=247 RepID=UPI0039B01E65
MINEELLIEFGGEIRDFKKKEVFFEVGHYPSYYYQIVEGKVKMNNFSEEGKEFIQNIFIEGQSFGEPPLFVDEPYPANAIAVTKGKVIQIPKTSFFELLKSHPEVSLIVNKSLARRLYYKSIMAPEISSQTPERRLIKLLYYLRAHDQNNEAEYLINFSRQQLGDLTGLRVETVIRTIKILEKKGELEIRNGKIILISKD